MESPTLTAAATVAATAPIAASLSEPASPASRSRSSSRSSLRLDLSNIPPLVQPTKPSNTLLITVSFFFFFFSFSSLPILLHFFFFSLFFSLPPEKKKKKERKKERKKETITHMSIHPNIRGYFANVVFHQNLLNSEIFHPESLQNIRNIIATHANVITWSPLKSFRRVVCSFPSEEEATLVRQALDGSTIMGDRIRVYFGEHTPVEPVDQHLHAPESKKLFFISPPPSPPHGWEVKDEEPPNAQVLAEDLAQALSKLRSKNRGTGNPEGEQVPLDAPKPPPVESEGLEAESVKPISRTRSGSIMLFEPEKADEKHIPSISVDFSDGSEAGGSAPQTPISPVGSGQIFHTSRPPVELIHSS